MNRVFVGLILLIGLVKCSPGGLNRPEKPNVEVIKVFDQV